MVISSINEQFLKYSFQELSPSAVAVMASTLGPLS